MTTRPHGEMLLLDRLIMQVGGELTISSGAITVTHSVHSVDTEADDPSDDLETINGGVDGQLLILRAASSARTIVLKNATGNLRLASSDFSLTNSLDRITLYLDSGNWYELSRSDNGT